VIGLRIYLFLNQQRVARRPVKDDVPRRSLGLEPYTPFFGLAVGLDE